MTLPPRLDSDGVFPFGAPNGPRPWRWEGSGRPQQLLIGVYPSALHVSWRAPTHVSLGAGARGKVASLAVDVEPVVFWDGQDAAAQVRHWSEAVGFVPGDEPGQHGHFSAGTNGPSGDGLHTQYFPRLPFGAQQTAFLDVYPVFVVKGGAGSQGAAIAREYDPVAAQLSRADGSSFGPSGLGARPSSNSLPVIASERFGPWLVEALTELAPDHVVTLGQEPWATLALIKGVELRHDAPDLSSSRAKYGAPGAIVVGGRSIEWTPLAHPGLIRQAPQSSAWRIAHDAWSKGAEI